MTNRNIADHLSLLARLMDIHGENSFKAKSYSVAAYNIDQMQVEVQHIDEQKEKYKKSIQSIHHPKNSETHNSLANL